MTGDGTIVGEASDRVVGDHVGNRPRRLRAVGPEPVRRPVERAEKRTRRHGWIRGPQHAIADARRHQRPDAALVAVALGDDARAETGGERVHLEVRRGALDVVEEAQHVRYRHIAEPARQRT